MKKVCFFESCQKSLLAFVASKLVPKIVSKSTKNSLKIGNSDFLEIVLSPTREHENQGFDLQQNNGKAMPKHIRKKASKQKPLKSRFLLPFGFPKTFQNRPKLETIRKNKVLERSLFCDAMQPTHNSSEINGTQRL